MNKVFYAINRKHLTSLCLVALLLLFFVFSAAASAQSTSESSTSTSAADKAGFIIPGTKIAVKMINSKNIDRVEVRKPGGGGTWGAGDVAKPEKLVIDAPPGQSNLALELQFTNLGNPIRLKRQDLLITNKSGTPFPAIFWQQLLDSGMVLLSESFDIKGSLRITAVFYVPKDNWETLSFNILGRTVASLAQLRDHAIPFGGRTKPTN